MKKIKNPEKYIHNLKLKIKRLEDRVCDARSRRRQYAGFCTVAWGPGEPDKQECYNQNFGIFRVGDNVAVVGRVVEVHEQEGKSMIRFRRIQTKKVEAI